MVTFQFNFNSICVYICVGLFCSCLSESEFVCGLSDVGSECVHMEVCESVNGLTVKFSE